MVSSKILSSETIYDTNDKKGLLSIKSAYYNYFWFSDHVTLYAGAMHWTFSFAITGKILKSNK